jgi:hypothetical protein
MSEKWAQNLSSECGVEPKVLQFAMEELKETCYGDANTAKKIVEELTLSCGFKKEDLEKFIKEVSKNCPMDIKKLQEEVAKAEGEKARAFEAVAHARDRSSLSYSRF